MPKPSPQESAALNVRVFMQLPMQILMASANATPRHTETITVNVLFSFVRLLIMPDISPPDDDITTAVEMIPVRML